MSSIQYRTYENDSIREFTSILESILEENGWSSAPQRDEIDFHSKYKIKWLQRGPTAYFG